MGLDRINHGATITPGRVNQVIDHSVATAPQSSGLASQHRASGTELFPLQEQGQIYAVITGRREISSRYSNQPPRIQYEWKEVTAGLTEEEEIWVETHQNHDCSWNEELELLNNPAVEVNGLDGIEEGTIVQLTPRDEYLEFLPNGEHRTITSWAFTHAQSVLEPFIITEDLIPGQIEGGLAADEDAEETQNPFVRGYLLKDPEQTELYFYPPQRTDRFDDAGDVDNVFNGVGRRGSDYYRGTRGWAKWIARALRDDSTGETRWVGQWQIVNLYASTICHANTGGTFTITDSDIVANTFTVAENLEGFISVGDPIVVQDCTLAATGEFTVTAVTYAAGATVITVTEPVGANNEAVGNLGKLLEDGETALVDLYWLNEDRHRDSPELIDSEYDVEVLNFSGREVWPGRDVLIFWDRQEYRWHLIHEKARASAITGEIYYAKVQTGFANCKGDAVVAARTVEVKTCDWDGTNVKGSTFDVIIPVRANMDTALFTDYVVEYRIQPDGTKTVANDVWDQPIGTVVWEALDTANIRDGWYLCDGANGTEDLSGQFIMCVDVGGLASEDALGDGTLNLDGGHRWHGQTENNHPDHVHAFSSGTGAGNLQYINDHTHTGPYNANVDTDNRPRYYVMAARQRVD